MWIDDPNRQNLAAVAEALGDLRDRVIFLGGAVAGLLITDPLADSVRPTHDVDAVVEAGLSAFHELEEQLARRGFARDIHSDVICRWTHLATAVRFDLMPVDADVLGFSNRWYRYAVETAGTIRLAPGLEIRAASAVAFAATKLEAYAGRGGGNILASHDLEDLLNVVDGRAELVGEVLAAREDVRLFVMDALRRLLDHPDFINGLPGMITDAARSGIVMERLRRMAHAPPLTED